MSAEVTKKEQTLHRYSYCVSHKDIKQDKKWDKEQNRRELPSRHPCPVFCSSFFFRQKITSTTLLNVILPNI